MRFDELKVYDINLDELKKDKFAVLKTEKGDIKLELFAEDAPRCCKFCPFDKNRLL